MTIYKSKFKNIGKTRITKKEECVLSTGASYWVDEHNYQTDSQSLGQSIIPVVDREGGYNSSDYKNYPVEIDLQGALFLGCEILDEKIRENLGLVPSTNIFASLSYFHPSNGELDFQEIDNPEKLKTEFSITHTGMYIGKGRTRNSPADYHEQKLKVKSYPALVSTIKLKGVDGNVLSENLYIVARLLNESNSGVDFPNEYKTDTFHLVSLNSLGSHLRAMLDNDWINEAVDGSQPFINIIEKCDLYKLYCAEHFWQVANVGLNIPQNETGYTEFYGETLGKKLFSRAKKLWEEINPESKSFPEIPYFTPLWKMEGIAAPPMNETTTGKGFYSMPQTSSDLIRDIVKTFAPWHEVGPSYSIALIFGFLENINERLGYTQQECLSLITEPVKMISKYYLKTVDLSFITYRKSLIEDLSKILEKEADALEAMISNILYDGENGTKECSSEEAYSQFEKAMEHSIEKLRALDPKLSFDELVKKSLQGEDVKKLVKYYSPPATIHKITRGLVKSSEFVEIATIGTIVDYRDIDLSALRPNVTARQESDQVTSKN